MGYLLKEALKTLCGVNQWSYAVFWKIDCQNPMLLIWEESYYEAASSLGNLHGFPENGILEINFQDYSNSSVTSESRNSWPSVPASDKVHFLVNKMMADGNVKVAGEGLVGMVAFTGNYQWILSENHCEEPQSLEVLKDVLQQFSAGMQTVTVIPVLPLGVVQFGSHVAVPENIGFVKDVVSLILELGHIPGVLQFENRETKELIHGVSPLGSNTFSTCSAGTFNSPECSTQITSFQASNSIGSFHVEPYEAKIAVPCLTSPNQFITEVSENSNVGTNLQSSSSMHTCVTEKGLAPNGLKDLTFIFQDAVDKSRDDLFDVLGADSKKNMFNNHLNGPTRNEPEKISPHGPIKLESGILSFMGTNHPMDATVSKGQPNMSLEESVSCMSTLTKIGGSSASKAFLPQGIIDNSDHMKGELFGISNYAAKGKEVSSTYSQGSCVYDPLARKGFGLKQNESLATKYSAKLNMTSKPSRKRPKPDENPRPRPRDRQMIQNRVKELREIVPNGAKCSIDCLLERTIKHMLFLQGFSKHADKLKQTTESKISDSRLKDDSGGVTWAYEVGSQSMVCPIIVEDINQQPHQMLVEMVCEERSSFLDIAGIIRGLELTILKGLMENRDGKVWARFTVEANHNVTRMGIFLSLVRLLDQNAKPGFPKPNIKTENVMGQECHQAASVIC